MTVSELEEKYKQVLPHDYRTFIELKKYDLYDGYRPRKLVDFWADSMSYPLCFDPEIVMDVFTNPSIWNTEDESFQSMFPLAVFYEANSIEQLNDMDDFLAFKVEDGINSPVFLWDHEGYFTKIAESIEVFLKSLISRDSPEWQIIIDP